MKASRSSRRMRHLAPTLNADSLPVWQAFFDGIEVNVQQVGCLARGQDGRKILPVECWGGHAPSFAGGWVGWRCWHRVEYVRIILREVRPGKGATALWGN
jgi:hypothetical protein